MAIVTTYVCDISGKQGTDKSEFVGVEIRPTVWNISGSQVYGTGTISINKLVSRDVALRLGLIQPTKNEQVQPEVTFESKLTTLLKDYIAELVYDEVQAAQN